MASYYYLMASLPLLRADGEMPFSYDEFLSQCRGSVSQSRYEMLSGLSADSSQGPLVSDWARFYGAIREELTYQRKTRLGREAQAPADRDELVVRSVGAVMEEKNPLLAEKMLLALEFETLDKLVNQHYFDEAALVGYALKLKLLERKTVFDKARGKAELDRIVSGLQQQITEMNV